MWTVQDIKWLDVDISASCNAGCIDCNRFLYDHRYNEFKLNSLHPYMNKLSDVDRWEDIIRQFENLKYIQLLGNVGDPMVHPKADQFVEISHKHHPDARIEINSNGSVGSIKTWQRICDLVPRLGNQLSLVFSIDGLEDTNHIYRRGVEWQRIMERAKLFIDAGGHAEWKMIDFPYNEHQREPAKQLAQDMGFKTFTVFPRQTPTPEFDQKIIDHSVKPVSKDMAGVPDMSHDKALIEHQKMVDHFADQPNFEIMPKCMNTKSDDVGHWPNFQINVEGTLWPCCFASNLQFSGSVVAKHFESVEQKYIKKYGKHWNNLYHTDLKTILQSDWFRYDLPNSWNTPSQSYFMCLENCGTCRDRPQRIQEQFDGK